MSEIRRYVLVNPSETEDDYEYESLQTAIEEAAHRHRAGTPHAVIGRTYIYHGSELVWTPDRSDAWPPPPPPTPFQEAQQAFDDARRAVIWEAQKELPAVIRAIFPEARAVALDGQRGDDNQFGFTIINIYDEGDIDLDVDGSRWDEFHEATAYIRDYWAASDDGIAYSGRMVISWDKDGNNVQEDRE